MGWFILKHIFSTILSIINITRLSNQEKDLEILILRQQLSILQRKHNSPIQPNRVEKITLAVLAARLKRITHRSANQLRDIIRIFQPETILPCHRDSSPEMDLPTQDQGRTTINQQRARGTYSSPCSWEPPLGIWQNPRWTRQAEFQGFTINCA